MLSPGTNGLAIWVDWVMGKGVTLTTGFDGIDEETVEFKTWIYLYSMNFSILKKEAINFG